MSLVINQTIIIGENELKEEFIRSSGPGGQNVNKVSSAVLLRFNLAKSLSIPDNIKTRLLTALKNQLNKEGEILITSQTSRNQKDNRIFARKKLIRLLQKALIIPKSRKKTKPTAASQKRRLDSKHKHSEYKKMRKKPTQED